MEKLITTCEQTEFVPELIKRRGFIRAKYWSWEEPRNGLITYADKGFLRVLFLTGVNVAASYYAIKITEVEAGLWTAVYTPDFKSFYCIKQKEKEEEEPESDIDLIEGIRKLFEE